MNAEPRGAEPAQQASVIVVVPVVGEARVENMPAEADLLATLRDRIGCAWVETTAVLIEGHPVTVWFDEEGALADAPVANPQASRLLAHAGLRRPILLGSAVLTGGPDRHGDTTGLPVTVARRITALINHALINHALTNHALTNHSDTPDKDEAVVDEVAVTPGGVSPVFTDGRPQVMAQRCSTCILRPGGSGLVPPQVVPDLVDRHRVVGAVVVCHQTLPRIPGSTPELGFSACRGFLDAYPDTLAARLVEPFFGGWHPVPAPTDTRPGTGQESTDTTEETGQYRDEQPPS